MYYVYDFNYYLEMLKYFRTIGNLNYFIDVHNNSLLNTIGATKNNIFGKL